MSGGVTRRHDAERLERIAARLYRVVAELAELRDAWGDAGSAAAELPVEELRAAVARLAALAAARQPAAPPPRPYPTRRRAGGDAETARRLRRWLADRRFRVDLGELTAALADDDLPYVETRTAEEAGLDVFPLYGRWLAAWRDGSDPSRWQLVAIGAGGRLDEVG